MNDTRPFPIQADSSYGKDEGGASSIPWWLAEIAYKQYAKQFGNKQNLERLAQRGGFGRAELLNLLRMEEEFPAQCLCPADGHYSFCPVHRTWSLR